jgi:hypothetical protein
MIHVRKISAKRSTTGKALVTSSALAFAFATHACGPAGDASGENSPTTPDEGSGTVSKGLDQAWVRGPHHVIGPSEVDIGSASTEVCVLTRITGIFGHIGHYARVKVVDGRWELIVSAGVQATAHCFQFPLFVTAGNARELVHDAPVGLVPLVFPNDCDNENRQVNLGDAVSYIAEVSGFFEGFGESITSTQGLSRDHANRLIVNTCHDNPDQAINGPVTIEGRTNTFYAGPPRFTVPMPPAQFVGPGGKGRVDVAGTFALEVPGFPNSPNSMSRPMVPTLQAMCHLTKIAGEFDGLGEAVWIDTAMINGVETWTLNGRTDFNTSCGLGRPTCPPKGGVQVEARCYLRDQRTACKPATTLACAQFGCGCASGQCSGGSCPGEGCKVEEIQACGRFGCGCTAGRCSGGACP